MSEINWLRQLSRRIGGPRFLALPFLRGLAVIAGFVWLALTPTDFVGWILLAFALAAFACYSLLLYLLIWLRPGLVFRLQLPVLLLDLAFALFLIRLSGGAESTLFLALLLIPRPLLRGHRAAARPQRVGERRYPDRRADRNGRGGRRARRHRGARAPGGRRPEPGDRGARALHHGCRGEPPRRPRRARRGRAGAGLEPRDGGAGRGQGPGGARRGGRGG